MRSPSGGRQRRRACSRRSMHGLSLTRQDERPRLAKAMSRLYLIGNAHLDPVWLWRWPEGCAEAIGTCWAAVELLAQHPGAIFTTTRISSFEYSSTRVAPIPSRCRHLATASACLPMGYSRYAGTTRAAGV